MVVLFLPVVLLDFSKPVSFHHCNFVMESLSKIGKQGYDYINRVAADYGEQYEGK